MFITLETPRLIIRDHIFSDLQSHHELLSNKKVMYYLPELATDTIEESEKNLQAAISGIDSLNRECYFLRIEDKLSKEFIGEIGYTVDEVTHFGKLVGVGYFIHEKFWGRGYISEAIAELIRFAFENDNVFRISCGCLKENAGSEKVMIKSCMIKEAEFKQKVLHDGILKDRVEYRLLKSEWKK